MHDQGTLAWSPERLIDTLNAVREGVQIIGRDWRYLYVNDAVCRQGKLSREDLLGRTMSDCYPGIEETELYRTLARCMSEGQPLAFENHFAYPNGSQAWFELRVEPCPEGIFVLSVDVTERKRFEAQVRQVEKMNAIGNLAGGVAHDFNNLLTAIKGFTTFSLEAVPADQPVAEDLREVLNAADRAASLTSQLLAFARAQPVVPRVIDVNERVRALDKLLRRLLGANVAIVTRPGSNLWPTLIDPNAFEQVLVNLAINARDAMPDGGQLTIETHNVTLDEAQANRRGAEIPAGDYVVLAVSDDGTGMPTAVQERIFEPFFTTKGAGRGTGLGLSTCFGIVHQAGGFIWLYSEPGHGTTFKIYLPRSQERARAEDLTPSRRSLGSETVLLVEDDGQVRDIAARTLSRAGYDVRVAARAEEALALAVDVAPRHLHLLVTDMVLPGKNGRDLAEELLSRRADLRVLYVSGYTEAAITRRAALPAGATILAKPFTPRQLIDKVREVLDR